MSERGWKFAEDWVARNVTRATLDDMGEMLNLRERVHALRDRLFIDAKREDITAVEIEEYYDLEGYISDAIARETGKDV